MGRQGQVAASGRLAGGLGLGAVLGGLFTEEPNVAGAG